MEEVLNQGNYRLHIVPTKKFKTVHIIVKLKAPLNRETITKRALLPYVLRQGTKSYPNEQALQKKLDSLYGAGFSMDGVKKGNNHIISFRLQVANEKYIANESTVIDEAMSLLGEIIFSPNVTDGSFQPKVVEREKETLKQKINAVMDDKMAYANMRLIDEMCEGEVYQVHVQGYEEDLEHITAASLYEYYQHLLQEDQMDIYVLGDFDQNTLKTKIDHIFKQKNSIGHTLDNQQEKTIKKRETSPKEVIEEQNVQQAKLHIGYRTHTTYQSEEYSALHVFNGLFGGFPSSKLFINVREKNSLAYYAASRMESHKGLIFVVSGIAPEDYKKAREIIEAQMTAMRNGDFSEDDMNNTKELIVNQLLETLDHPQGIVEMLYQQILANKELSPTDLIKGIKQVTKEEVVRIANKIEEDTIYLLTNKGESNE